MNEISDTTRECSAPTSSYVSANSHFTAPNEESSPADREREAPPRGAFYEVHRFVSLEKAKLMALLIVLGCACNHALLRYKYGSNSCQWLINDGHFQGYNEWQPFGCMMHQYTKSDARNCMHYISYWGGQNHIAFVGDSRLRQLYYDFASLLSSDKVQQYKSHSDLSFIDEKLSLAVEFYWQPVVNESMLDVYRGWLSMKSEERPKLVITGSATWSIKDSNGSDVALENFRENMTSIVSAFEELKYSSKVIWMLQDPVLESHLSGNRSMITNARVDQYNRAALEKLLLSSVHIWSSSRLLASGFLSTMLDGLHVSSAALSWDSQILLNMYCNDHMNFNDGTCCTSVEAASVVQLAMLLVFTASLCLALGIYAWRWHLRRICVHHLLNGRSDHSTPLIHGCDRDMCLNTSTTTQSASLASASAAVVSRSDDAWYEVATCIARLGVVILYFFLCDRTTFFMKENKYYTNVNFFLPFSYLMILGLFFTEKTKQPSILSRDQTDEWKGWMQLVILIYHLTGASKILPIYMQIRVMVSSYLFLSGYGHFCYFFNKGDFTLHRLLTVLVRFNFLVMILCLVMNRPYQFYYFVPLVSFWFVTIYITMSVWPRITTTSVDNLPLQYLFLLIKFSVLITIITLMYASEVFFERIFLSRVLKPLFVSADDSVVDWRFRWQLDRYSTVYGMGFALALIVAKKRKLLGDTGASQSGLCRVFIWAAGFLSVIGLVVYTVFTHLCPRKKTCNVIHSYLAFIPIVVYICLRNIHESLRAKYSMFFAWFGRISLELFVAQYHIWLAADTHGLLVLLPGYPVMNIVLSSFVFVCAAHEIHDVTARLLPHLVPHDFRRMICNVAIAVTVAVPLALARAPSPTFS